MKNKDTKDVQDFELLMSGILSCGLAISSMSYDALHCNADKKMAIRGIGYRIKDLVDLFVEIRIDEINQQNQEEPNEPI